MNVFTLNNRQARTVRAALALAIQAERDRLALRAWTEAEHMEEAKIASERNVRRFEQLLHRMGGEDVNPRHRPPRIKGELLFPFA